LFIIGKLKHYDKAFPAIGQEKKSPKLTEMGFLNLIENKMVKMDSWFCGKMRRK
jgi:hypothetical protein